MSVLKESHQRLIDGFKTVLVFAVQNSKTDVDENVVAEVQAQLAEIDLTKNVSEKELVEAAFEILDVTTDFTKTQTDDKVVDFAKGIYAAVSGGQGVKPVIDSIKALIEARKAKRNEKNAEVSEVAQYPVATEEAVAVEDNTTKSEEESPTAPATEENPVGNTDDLATGN